MEVCKRFVLYFPSNLIEKPIIYHLTREYNLVFNILKASINPHQEGLMVLELSGTQEQFDAGVKYLQEFGVRLQPLSHDVRWDEAKCTHCGACTALCPTAALYIERPSMEVRFDESRCVACEACVKACPVRAMVVEFEFIS